MADLQVTTAESFFTNSWEWWFSVVILNPPMIIIYNKINKSQIKNLNLVKNLSLSYKVAFKYLATNLVISYLDKLALITLINKIIR